MFTHAVRYAIYPINLRPLHINVESEFSRYFIRDVIALRAGIQKGLNVLFLSCHRILDRDCDDRTDDIILCRERPGQDSGQSCLVRVLIGFIRVCFWGGCCLSHFRLLIVSVVIVVVIVIPVIIPLVLVIASLLVICLSICLGICRGILSFIVVKKGLMRA